MALCRAATRSPRSALGGMLALTLAGAVGLGLIEFRTDGQALVPRADPAVRFDAEVRARFGLGDPIVVHIETTHAAGVYNVDTLRLVQDLGTALADLPEIGPQKIMSLATEARPRVHPGTLRFRRLLDPFPDTPELMGRLRADIDAIQILTGNVVTADRRGTAIVVDVPPSRSADPAGVDRAALYAEISALARPFENEAHHISVVGAPIAEALLGEHILADLRLLIPLAMAVVASVIFFACRRAWAVWLALAEVGACLLFTFGVMAWCGVPVYLTTAVLPVILTAIGIADELHVIWRYQQCLGETAAEGDGATSHVDAVDRALSAMSRPVTITSLTTAVGFLSFVVAPIGAVAAFGAFAALGVAYCWLFTIVAVPAALALLPPGRLRRPAQTRFARAREVTQRAHALALAHPKHVLVGSGALGLVATFGAVGLTVQDSWIDGFAKDSEFRLASEYVDTRLHGTHVLLAHIAFEAGERPWPRARRGEQGPLLDPEVLGAIGRFESDIAEAPGVGGVLGPASHIETVNFLFLAQQAETRRIPESYEHVARVIRRFDAVRGEHRRRAVIHDDLHQGMVTILVRGANYRDTDRIMRAVREAEERHLRPIGAHVGFAGDLAVSQAMIPAIVETQLGSLALALAGAFACAWILFRSATLAILTIAPTLAAVLCLFGAMGWLGIPIGVATSTFCAITLGIGIDYAVHLLAGIRAASETGERAGRLQRAVADVAPPILADALAVSLGFAVLLFSQVPANARLGIIVAVALVTAATLTLLGIPALLSTASGRIPERMANSLPIQTASPGGPD